MRNRSQPSSSRKQTLTYTQLESKHLLATLAEAGISQRVINYVDQLPWTNQILTDAALQNTLNGIMDSQIAPANAQLITSAGQFSQIQSGGTYLIQGDITVNSTFQVPSNVTIYVDGSIFKQGNFTAPGGVHSAENYDDAIFEVTNNVSNVNLIGIDNALLHSNPSLNPSQPHASAVIVESGASNVVVEGFEIANVWNALVGFWGTDNVLFRNNYIHDTLDRAIWMLGTTDTAVVHNFIENPGIDGIDFDAYTDFSTAYENVVIGAGRWAGFVEEGAHDNFLVRGLAVMADFGNPNTGYQMGWADNGTSQTFANNNPGVVTENNFFIDNVVFRPSSFQDGGDYFSNENAGGKGWTYFWGNRGYGAGPSTNLMDMAEWLEFIPTSGGPNGTVNGVQVLLDLDELYNDDVVEPATYAFRESAGLVSMEAENFTRSFAGTGNAAGKEWQLVADTTSSGGDAMAALSDTGVNTGDNINGPRLDFEIEFANPGSYRVFLRTLGPNTGSNSVHVGLDGASLTSNVGNGVGDGSNEWVWVDDIANGPSDLTIDISQAGRHTLNIWMREDGTRLDKIVLDQTATTPVSFGPSESPRGLAPTATNDQAVVDEDTPIVLDVIANDTDPEEDELTLIGTTQPSFGTVSINADNSLTYLPAQDYSGSDTFTYTITDGYQNSSTAVVTIDVTPVNDAPMDIQLSVDSISESISTSDADVTVGLLSATDVDSPILFFDLTQGMGDDDNGLFEVVGNQLMLKQGTTVDFESQSSFSVRVFAADEFSVVEQELLVRVDNEVEQVDITIGDDTEQRSKIDQVEIQFDAPVSVAPGAIQLRHRGTGEFVTTTIELDASNKVATLTFSGSYVYRNSSTLINGNYELIMDGDGIQSLDSGNGWDADEDGSSGGFYRFGNQAIDNFYALFGDINGDRQVNLVDYGLFRRAITHGVGEPEYLAAFDLNGDGRIDLLDGEAFRANVGIQLPFN